MSGNQTGAAALVSPRGRIAQVAALALSIGLVGRVEAQDSALARPTTRPDGSMRIPAFDLPVSVLLGPESRAALAKWSTRAEGFKSCPTGWDSKEKALALRVCVDQMFTPAVDRHRALYGVDIKAETIGGVRTEVFTPTGGVPRENQNRVLINVHGGGFVLGAGINSRIESIPIAALGKLKVVSIDYRMAPEHQFPAASEDVAAVYREILKQHRPENIGVYGCSAGGLLTAQAVAWFQKQGLPRPGAVGMFCAAAGYWDEGDTGYFINGGPASPKTNPYFKNTDPNDPLAFPLRSAAVMAKFPPSLLIAATRDFALSSVVKTHTELVKHRVPAELYIWEGLGHAFFMDPDFPESREMYDVTVRFFDKYLGK